MLSLNEFEDARFTRTFSLFQRHHVPANCVYVFARNSPERRGRHPVWDEVCSDSPGTCIQVDPASGTADLSFQARLFRNNVPTDLSLRDDKGLRDLRGAAGGVVIDISGITHQVWAPLVRAFLSDSGSCRQDLWVLYVEPERYRRHTTPTTLGSFDLSESIEGIRPIPGFARLLGTRRTSSQHTLVGLVGFEGARARHVFAELEPPDVVAIIGLPGFRFDFPCVAAACNESFFRDAGVDHSKLRYARASCPFDVYDVIETIVGDHRPEWLQIAPIGTKPHALGAFLYAIAHPEATEIVYDHPVRRPGRCDGVGETHLYDVAGFMDCVRPGTKTGAA